MAVVDYSRKRLMAILGIFSRVLKMVHEKFK